jgi:hypothetical protein
MSEEDLALYIKTRKEAVELIDKSTCQFYILKKGTPISSGSGVCVKINEVHFILTAAHVVEDRINELYLRFEKGITLMGCQVNTNKINFKRNDDKQDIAILKLNNETVEFLNGFYTFLEEEDLGINHQLVDSAEYLAYGYPASMTKMKYKTNIIDAKSTLFTTKPAEVELYKKLNCKEDSNIIINYNKTGLVSMETLQVGTGPDVYGMSGCGLWYIPVLAPGQEPQKKLISILTEWPPEDKHYIISTKIDVFTEIIRQTYKLNLPKSYTYLVEANLENLDDNESEEF